MSDHTNGSDFGDLRKCLQCAVCTGSCPTARVVQGYNPREIVLRHLMNGDEPTEAELELVWCCATCRTCEERCPHGIRVGEAILRIMNRAAVAGRLPEAVRQSLSTLSKTGRAIPATARVERLRSDLGLKPLAACDTAKVQALLRKCGVEEMLEAKCE